MHGMPVSFLMGLTPPVQGFEWLDMDKPALGLDQLVYIGLRDLEVTWLLGGHLDLLGLWDLGFGCFFPFWVGFWMGF